MFYYRDNCTSMFTVSVFTTGRDWKQPRCPSTDKWVVKCSAGIFIDQSVSNK